MRVIIQRAKNGQVAIDGQVVGQIDHGFVLLVGFTHGDSQSECDYCVRKIANMRLFEDEEGKTNLSIDQVGGQILSVSQFSLYADTKKGNRPSFIKACEPGLAEELYHYFNKKLAETGLQVETGQFGADMKVSFINDGPMTIILDTNENN